MPDERGRAAGVPANEPGQSTPAASSAADPSHSLPPRASNDPNHGASPTPDERGRAADMPANEPGQSTPASSPTADHSHSLPPRASNEPNHGASPMPDKRGRASGVPANEPGRSTPASSSAADHSHSPSPRASNDPNHGASPTPDERGRVAAVPANEPGRFTPAASPTATEQTSSTNPTVTHDAGPPPSEPIPTATPPSDPVERAAREVMNSAIRRLTVLEVLILAGAAFAATLGGLITAFLAQSAGFSFAPTWAVTSVLLLLLPGLLVWARQGKTKGRTPQKAHLDQSQTNNPRQNN